MAERAYDDQEWMPNDIGRLARTLSRFVFWPGLVFIGVFGPASLAGVPLLESLIAGALAAALVGVVGYLGERRVAVRVSVSVSRLAWVDFGGRIHEIPLYRVQNIQRLPRRQESIIWYTKEDGERGGFGVGPQVAERVLLAIETSGV